MSAKNQEFFLSICSALKASRLSFFKGFVEVSSILQFFYFDIFETSFYSTGLEATFSGKCMRDFEEKLPLIFQDIWALSHVKAKEMLLISDFSPSPLFTRELVKKQTKKLDSSLKKTSSLRRTRECGREST